MTTSNSISIAASAPSYASNSINTDRTACGGGLTAALGKHWDGRTYVGDFPPYDHIGPGIVQPGPIWIEPYVYPHTKPVEPIESFRRMLEKVTPPPTKFRVT